MAGEGPLGTTGPKGSKSLDKQSCCSTQTSTNQPTTPCNLVTWVEREALCLTQTDPNKLLDVITQKKICKKTVLMIPSVDGAEGENLELGAEVQGEISKLL